MLYPSHFQAHLKDLLEWKNLTIEKVYGAKPYTMTRDDVIKALPEVVALLGTWDITTIRASIGMYLCCKAIHEQTDVRVLLTGEISDELFGYKYTDFAPSAAAFQQESKKRVDELYMYDVLRADRCIGDNSIEARVPFGDLDFVKYVMAWLHAPMPSPAASGSRTRNSRIISGAQRFPTIPVKHTAATATETIPPCPPATAAAMGVVTDFGSRDMSITQP